MTIDLTDLPDVFDALDADDLDVLARSYAAEKRKIELNPLEYGHLPHPVQEEIFVSEHRITLLVAGNRLGKSEAAMRECLWRARGEHPYKQVKLIDQLWIGVPGEKFLRETTLPHFEKWCPPDWKLTEVNKSDWWVEIRRKDGGKCTIYFKTFEQGREVWQGAAVGFIHLDEECPEDIYKEARARLVDTRGSMLLTLTPVSGMGWIYDRLYLPGLGARAKTIKVVQGALAEHDPSQYLGVGRVLVPHLTREDVVLFAEDYPDPDELAIRVFGQFRKRAGLIYKAYEDAIHLVEPFEVPQNWFVWGGVDPGYHGFAATIFAMSPEGIIYVVDEYFSSGETISTRLTALCEKYLRIRRPPEPDPAEPDDHAGAEPAEQPWVDACVFFVDTEDPQTVLELNTAAAERELPVVFASLEHGLKAVKAGILRVQKILQPFPTRATPAEVTRARPQDGEPGLYIFKGLHSEWRVDEQPMQGCRLVWELKRYTWKKPKRDSILPVDEPDKESAAGAHVLDTLRYGVMARLAPIEESRQEAEKPPPGVDPDVWKDVLRLESELERSYALQPV